jgi:putative addiction module component (TIGR02574 family)
MMTHLMKDILKLSIPERILMVEAIWDSIHGKEETIELSNETKQILDDRLQSHKNNPDEGSDWNDVKDRIQKQL